MYAGAGATVDEDCNVAQALPRDGVHDIRVARIHVNFVDARILIVLGFVAVTFTKHLAPVLAAIGGLVEATIAASRPQWALRGNEDRV